MQLVSNIPIYIQIADDLKRKMITGEIKAGDKLPSNRELAIEYKINPNTVQRTYRELELENLCFTKRGIGVFATEDKNIIEKMKNKSIENIVDEFIKRIKSMNITKEEFIKMTEEIWED
jgi:DNA-binding transcriptional regulator YhcF (GntR family)